VAAEAGDRDFMRPFAHSIYGIPPERVIGSGAGLDGRQHEGRLGDCFP